MHEIVSLIQRIAWNTVQAGRPSDLTTGTVTLEEPLKIKLAEGTELDGDFLQLSRNVTDYKLSVTIPERKGVTEDGKPVTLKKEKTEMMIHGALKQGETVLLLQKSGGQEYVVLDRIKEEA